MLNDVASYYLKNDGRIWVPTMSKYHRPASDTEGAVIQKNAVRKFRPSAQSGRPRLHLTFPAHAALPSVPMS